MVKVNIECQVRGDVVIECGHVGENTDEEEEEAMFSIMFNTCFLESNMMVLTLDDIDLPWNCRRERFQEDFKIEVYYVYMHGQYYFTTSFSDKILYDKCMSLMVSY